MAHHCHAAGCSVRTPPEMFCCKSHWFKLPKRLRDEVWRTYRSGQCEDWEITHEYAEAAREAVRYLAVMEGRSERELAGALVVYDMLDPARYQSRKLSVTRAGKRVEVELCGG